MSGGSRGVVVRVIAAAATALALLIVGASAASASGFGDPFLVSSPAADDIGSSEGHVAADGEGNFTYVWVQRQSSTLTEIRSVVVSADGSRGPTNVIATAESFGLEYDYFSDMSISAGPDGQVHLAWSLVSVTCPSACNPLSTIKYVNLDSTGAPLATPVTVSTLPLGHYPVGPELATSGTGRTGIIWGDFDSFTDVDILMAIALDGANPLSPFSLTSEDWDGIQYLDISGSSNGTLFPLWSGYHGGSGDIEAHGKLITDSGTITPERQLMVANSSLDSVEGQIDQTGRASAFAVDFEGNQLIKFRQIDPLGEVVGSGPTKVSLDQPTDAKVGKPFTAVAPDGTLTATFSQAPSAGENPGVWTRTISPTGVPGAANSIVPANPDSNFRIPSVATGPDGSGFVSWQEQPLTSPEDQSLFYFARPMAADGTATGVEQLLGQTTVSPEVETTPDDATFSADGNGVALWSERLEAADFESQLLSVVFDASAPEVVLWSAPAATVDQEIVVAVEASDNSDLTFAWKFDGIAVPGTGPAVHHTFTTAGEHVVEATVTDEFGNETSVDAMIAVNAPPSPPVPPIPPDTRITGKPGKKVKAKTATFKFISSLTGSKFECRLDKAGWTDCKSPKKLKKLKPGKHTFRVRAIKGDLLDKSPATYSWNVTKKKR